MVIEFLLKMPNGSDAKPVKRLNRNRHRIKPDHLKLASFLRAFIPVTSTTQTAVTSRCHHDVLTVGGTALCVPRPPPVLLPARWAGAKLCCRDGCHRLESGWPSPALHAKNAYEHHNTANDGIVPSPPLQMPVCRRTVRRQKAVAFRGSWSGMRHVSLCVPPGDRSLRVDRKLLAIPNLFVVAA